MAFEVIWSRRATASLEDIVATIASERASAAQRFSAELVSRVLRLKQFPRSGAVYVRRRGFEVRQITYKKYRILYQVRPRLQRIEILEVRHGARQEPRLRRRKGQ